jgi:hypothetical protein
MITIFAAFVVGIRILIQKKFSERKFVKIGFWITFLIPVFILLVLFGACALSWGFGINKMEKIISIQKEVFYFAELG